MSLGSVEPVIPGVRSGAVADEPSLAGALHPSRRMSTGTPFSVLSRRSGSQLLHAALYSFFHGRGEVHSLQHGTPPSGYCMFSKVYPTSPRVKSAGSFTSRRLSPKGASLRQETYSLGGVFFFTLCSCFIQSCRSWDV